jgi:uncharacterized protein YkwD/uncharacterized protein YegL
MNNHAFKTDYYADYDVNTFFSIANLQQRITKLFANVDLLNAAVFWFTNVERKKFNLKQFQYHNKLRQTATFHSEQMTIHNFFSHENVFDTSCKTLKDRIGFVKDNDFKGFMSWGENISYQGKEPFDYSYREFAKIVIEGWMNSPGHRANILNPDFEYLGCGCAKYEQKENGYSMLCFKLTQNFGGKLMESSFPFGFEKKEITQSTFNPRVLENIKKFNALSGGWGQKINFKNMNDIIEQIDDVTESRTFHQLGVLCLDGSGSMTAEGDGGVTLAGKVNRAVREFLGFFKQSNYQNCFSIAVVTFDHTAAIHTPITELVSVNDFADYNPLNGHGGGTNIGSALEIAEKFATDFLSNSEANIVPHDVRIIVMSDGMCQHEDSTKQIAERLKQNDNITICASLFTTKANIGDNETNQAKSLLQEIASNVNCYKTTYGEKDLREFFIASMSAKRRYGK